MYIQNDIITVITKDSKNTVITKDSKKTQYAGVYFKTCRNMAKQISIFWSAEWQIGIAKRLSTFPSAFRVFTQTYTPVAQGNWNRRKPLVFPPTRSRRSATQILLRRASIHFVRYHFVYHSRILKSSVWCVHECVFSNVPPFARVSPTLQISIFSQLTPFSNICPVWWN